MRVIEDAGSVVSNLHDQVEDASNRIFELEKQLNFFKLEYQKLKPAAEKCADCGEPGESTGHQTCQYPQDH